MANLPRNLKRVKLYKLPKSRRRARIYSFVDLKKTTNVIKSFLATRCTSDLEKFFFLLLCSEALAVWAIFVS